MADYPPYFSPFLVVLHNSTEDSVQQDERLSDGSVWRRDPAVSGLCDAADSFTNPPHLFHHLDGSLMASGKTVRLWVNTGGSWNDVPRFSCAAKQMCSIKYILLFVDIFIILVFLLENIRMIFPVRCQI